MWLTRRHLVALGIVGLGQAGLSVGEAARIPLLSSGPMALGGFDAVSYHLDGPEPGQPTHEVVWHGRTWRFARAANRDAFRQAPEAYAPRLWGFDAIGILAGRLVDTDPLVFARYPGPDGVARLYLLRNADHRTRFLSDPTIAEQAEARWPALRNQIERDFPDETLP